MRNVNRGEQFGLIELVDSVAIRPIDLGDLGTV